MAWKATFDKGVTCFKRGDLEEALSHMDKAAVLESGNFIIYDSRAAVHERLGNVRAALLDSKRVIDLAPDRWQGYVRSARLFDLLGKHGHTIRMVDHSLSHLRPEDVQRRTPLIELRVKAIVAQAAAEKQVAETSYLLGKLPVETLVEIFAVLVDEDHTWAIKLSQVCGHWRRILINTPSAWRTLVLSRKHPLQKAKSWKERAKNHISRLSIDVSDLDRGSVFAQLQDVSWDDLSSLRMSGQTFVELHRMLSDIPLSPTFSKLDELELFDCRTGEELSCYESGSCSELKILRLSGLIGMSRGWPAQIQQLKELHLSGYVAHLPREALAANPLLEKLVLNCQVVGFDDFDVDAGLTSMEKLKTVECRGVAQPFEVLGGISAPSIMQFTMISAVEVDGPLLRFASRPSLVELHIGGCSLSPLTLPTLLSSTPNLEILRVNTMQAVVNDIFAFLTPKTDDSLRELPCRALKHVDVSYCSDLTTSCAYAFVKTRAHYASETAGPSLKCAAVVSLQVDGCPNIEPDMLPWFRSKVPKFSCVYATKKDFAKNRRRNL